MMTAKVTQHAETMKQTSLLHVVKILIHTVNDEEMDTKFIVNNVLSVPIYMIRDHLPKIQYPQHLNYSEAGMQKYAVKYVG